jgi:hypothetical protein
MLVRHFIAPDRTSWRVWAVHPAGILSERRANADRRRIPVDQAIDPPLLERRRGVDRRRLRTRSRGSHVLPQQWQEGWLVFEADGSGSGSTDVRRLAPVPQDWESCPESALARYLEHAQTAERRIA